MPNLPLPGYHVVYPNHPAGVTGPYKTFSVTCVTWQWKRPFLPALFEAGSVWAVRWDK